MAILARINQIADHLGDFKKMFSKEGNVAISKYLDERFVLFLNAKTRDEVLKELVDLLDQEGKLKNRQEFYNAILEREKVVSTGIGLGIAIPHAKLEGYDDFFIAIAVQEKEGVEWKALDGAPVRLIFMIGGPDNKQTEYLKILSHLTIAIKNEERRKKLLKALDPTEVVCLFSDC